VDALVYGAVTGLGLVWLVRSRVSTMKAETS
jgi:hypothetical protein